MIQLIEKLIGTVQEINGDSFIAAMDDGSIETFDINEVHSQDRLLLKIGAQFYWTNCYETTPGGAKLNTWEVRMKRTKEIK